MANQNDYLGSGIKFPFVLTTAGALAVVSGDEYLAGALINLLNTPQGTIIGQRNYGNRIEKALYLPLEIAKGVITETVRECIENWGDGVRFGSLQITENTDTKIEMLIQILVDNTRPLAFIFPYYKNI